MADEKKIQLIKGLLAKARATTGPESDAFAAQATELMARYSVEAAMLEDAPGSEKSELVCKKVRFKAPYIPDKAALFIAIADVFGCKSVWRDADNWNLRGEKILSVYGYQSDFERTHLLFGSLNLHMAGELVNAPGPGYRESRAAYNRSFMAGYTNTVWRRLKAAHAAAAREAAPTATGRGADLVLVDRERAVVAFRDGLTGKLKKRSGRRLSGSGAGAGSRAGARADLGGNRIGQNAGRSSLGSA
jgi:hypothetical protein